MRGIKDRVRTFNLILNIDNHLLYQVHHVRILVFEYTVTITVLGENTVWITVYVQYLNNTLSFFGIYIVFR